MPTLTDLDRVTAKTLLQFVSPVDCIALARLSSGWRRLQYEIFEDADDNWIKRHLNFDYSAGFGELSISHMKHPLLWIWAPDTFLDTVRDDLHFVQASQPVVLFAKMLLLDNDHACLTMLIALLVREQYECVGECLAWVYGYLRDSVLRYSYRNALELMRHRDRAQLLMTRMIDIATGWNDSSESINRLKRMQVDVEQRWHGFSPHSVHRDEHRSLSTRLFLPLDELVLTRTLVIGVILSLRYIAIVLGRFVTR